MQHIRGANGPILGKFRIATFTGLTTGLAGSTPIFSMRFAPAGSVPVRALITDFRLKAQIVTPFTAANEINVLAYIARSFTASDTGGISVLPAGISNMLSSISDAGYTTNFTDIRVAGTAALGAGTRTLDTSPFATLLGAQVLAAASAASAYEETALTMQGDQRYTINLQGQTGGVAANAEGIVVLCNQAQGAGGVVRYAFDVEWLEYATNSAEVIG